MGFADLRAWLDKLEAEGELKRIRAKVDWDGEIAGIVSKVFGTRGPAVLFENIKDHENTWCRKLFAAGLNTRGRVALALGLPKNTSQQEIVQLFRKRFKEPIKPVTVQTGPVKENIIKGKDVDLFQIPVPKWHPKDGGRYINTWCGVVTADPDTGDHNVGMYRGMIAGNNKVSLLLVPAQDWGIHYQKYQRMGKPMPIALVYGTEPTFGIMSATPWTGATEYEFMGALRQEPVPLVKCETNDILVPASAEIVLEGTVSPDPSTYEMEGPFGEWTGYYGTSGKRPVMKVDCITHRNDPIYRGSLEEQKPGVANETAMVAYLAQSAMIFSVLETQGIPGVIDAVPAPWTLVRIRKMYEGHARHIAAALWGSRLAVNICKTVIVVDEDVDIRNMRSLMLAIQSYVDPVKDIIIFPMRLGSNLDVSLSFEDRNELAYGSGLQNKFLIDATIDWTTHPIKKEWGNRRLPPTSEQLPETEKRVESRWREYGFSE